MHSLRKRLVLIGVGGASCSGKTLLAKHIRGVLPSGSTILHQDDFAPPIEKVPYAKDYPDIQDWDDPPTCILWPEFRSTLTYVRSHGTLPPLHDSHDHLNKQVEVAIDAGVEGGMRKALSQLSEDMARDGVELVWFIVDGFVLYWDETVVDLLDVRLFLRVPHGLLKRRRDERQVYVLQNPDDAAAGGVWVDPPNYFDQIVYPAYVKAHGYLFEGGNVEEGTLQDSWGAKGRKLVVMAPLEGGEEMTRAFQQSCQAIIDACRSDAGTWI